MQICGRKLSQPTHFLVRAYPLLVVTAHHFVLVGAYPRLCLGRQPWMLLFLYTNTWVTQLEFFLATKLSVCSSIHKQPKIERLNSTCRKKNVQLKSIKWERCHRLESILGLLACLVRRGRVCPQHKKIPKNTYCLLKCWTICRCTTCLCILVFEIHPEFVEILLYFNKELN